MHPGDIRAGDARPERDRNAADDPASESDPGETWQEFEKRMVEFGHATRKRRAVEETDSVGDFAAQNAETGVFFNG